MPILPSKKTEIISLDKLEDTLSLEIIGFFEDENKNRQYTKLKDFFKAHSPRRDWDAVSGSESPWWPSSLDLTALMMMRVNPGGPITEIGFGDGRVLCLLNKIFGIDSVYGCEIQPNLYDWAVRNSANRNIWADGSRFYYHSFPPSGLHEEDRLRMPLVALVQGDVRKMELPNSEYYFITPTRSLLDLVLPKISSGAKVIVYECYNAELERPLRKYFNILHSIQVQAMNLDIVERVKSDKIYLCEKI
jgi:hypothetical protein